MRILLSLLYDTFMLSTIEANVHVKYTLKVHSNESAIFLNQIILFFQSDEKKNDRETAHQ